MFSFFLHEQSEFLNFEEIFTQKINLKEHCQSDFLGLFFSSQRAHDDNL